METLDSAEKITRFLRGKDLTPQQISQTARALFSGSVPVYLPNHTYFVFDLVCDRLNDFTGKSFRCWKFEPEVWAVFDSAWRLLLSPLDREVRTKSFRRVKLVSIVSSVLEQCSAEYSEELLTAMFGCVENILATGYVDVDEYQAVGLLKAYVDLVSVAETKTTAHSAVNHWSTVILSICAIPHQAVSYKPTKKSTARFYSEPLPGILNVLALRTIDGLKPTYDILHSQEVRVVFGKDSALSLSLDSLVSAGLTAEGAEYLFLEVITHLASKDIALCESVYVKIMERFPELAEKLLDVLARVNRTLSSSFFLQIYEAEMARPTRNWRLVASLVGLDPELALSKWQDIAENTRNTSFSDGVVLAEKLACGFVKARDFSRFLKEVYPSALENAPVWSSEEVLAALSPKVSELSGNQIYVLIQHFMDEKKQNGGKNENENEKHTLTLILRGLLFCLLVKQRRAELLFVDYNFCHAGWAQVAYYVLCIYGESVVTEQPEIVLKIGPDDSKYGVYLQLRVSELCGDTTLVDVSACKKYLSQAETEQVVLFAERWLVLIDTFSEIHQVLFEKMLKGAEQSQMLAFFSAHEDVIYELPGFMPAFLRALRKAPVPYQNELFCCFPPAIFRKYFGFYVDSVAKDAISDPQNILARATLNHILHEPTFSSAIEKDTLLLRKLFDSALPDSLAVSMDIARSIWSGHLNNFKDEVSRKYVLDAYKSAQKTLKKPTLGDLAFARVILSTPMKNSDDVRNLHLELCVAFVSAVKNLKMPVESQLAALSDIFLDVSDEVLGAVRTMAKEIGAQAKSGHTRAQLFALVAKSGLPSVSHALFVTSLYVAVSSENLRGLKDIDASELMLGHLASYFEKLPNNVFVDIYTHVLLSLDDSPPSYVPWFVDILSVMAPLLTKAHQEEHTRLFVASVLAVALKTREVSHQQSLLRFLAAVTRMLSDHIWIVTQYGVELILNLGDCIVGDLDFGEFSELLYTAVVRMVSYVVLFHRYRLSSRYHLVVGITSRMMLPLATEKPLGSSETAASAYSRLLVALAEPAVQGSTKERDALTSQAATYKKLLRKHAHVLVVNYVHLQLTEAMETATADAVLPGIYSVLGLLSRTEMQLVSQCLDSLGKVYFKTLYGGYRDHGKWRDQ